MSSTGPRRWAVFVDGSPVSAKAFDAACLFVSAQTDKQHEDSLALVHAYDATADLNKAFHLRGPFILASYEANLIKARRIYDGQGLKKLKTKMVSREFTNNPEKFEVFSQDESGAPTTRMERAPALVAALLKCNAEDVHAKFIFVGSFGEGGKKINQNGTVTDYIVRLTNATTFIINHWRPLPRLGEPLTFVVAIDGNPTSRRAVTETLHVATKKDKIIGLLISRNKSPKEETIMQEINEMVEKAVGDQGPKCVCAWAQQQDSKGPVAQTICDEAEKMEADFLVIGSFNLRPGSAGRENIPLMGSAALYCSHNAKCHVVVVKPNL